MTEIERLLSTGVIPGDFLEEEIRHEYKVSSEMKKVWAIELDLLKNLVEFCSQNNLKIWVCYGTLLGAVRHKGMIPWDDDIDVYMPREDYNKLLQFKGDVLGSPYFIQSPFSDPEYFRSFARLRNSNTSVIEDPNHPRVPPYNSGIYIDIFPLDGMDAPLSKLKLKNRYIKFLSTIGHAYSININPNPILRLISKILHWPFIPFSTSKLFKHIGYIASKQPWIKASKVGLNIHFPYKVEKCVFEKEDFEETLWLPFEYLKVPVPKGFDRILQTIYGNYMMFPPKEKRGFWHSFIYDPDTPYKDCFVIKAHNK